MGGAETQLLQLARLLLEHGRYGVRMATLERSGVLWEEARRLPLGEIPEYPLRSFYDRNMLAQTRRFAAFLRAERVAVVHTEGFYTNIFGMAGAALARVPARIAFRGETGGFRTPRQLFVERCAYQLAHVVHANSEAVRRQLIAEGVPAQKIETVYNGLDLSHFTAGLTESRSATLARFKLPADAGRKFVTIVANMRHAVKDHPTFLRAARRVRAAVPEAAFVLAGEGELSDGLQALAAELGLERDAYFIGRCEREQVAELLSVSDVCVLSSTAEGFSNSILEYMAAGRPVVATDVGGAREAIVEGESGYLVAAGDDAGMAARLVELLRDEERARLMGARGREIVEQRFSAEAQLLNTEALYERTLQRAHAPIPEMTAGVSRERA
jgi:glycosyltransferase involved in cell wall biosynthesis